MIATRRFFASAVPFGVGAIVSSAAAASESGGTGYDVGPAPNSLKLIPRKDGAPVTFTASLDRAPAKATSGGWARDVTARTLPIATDIAGAHVFIHPGGAREMHWHQADEWGYVLAGHGQVTATTPAGETEVVNVHPGDLWYFPAGHAHAIQTLGDAPLHAILAFNDGLYGEHGTFGISDWMSRMDPRMVEQGLGLEPGTLGPIPAGETYIMQGPVLALDGKEAAAERPWPAERSHRYRLTSGSPFAELSGCTMRLATQAQFPVAGAMSGLFTHLQPGTMQSLHWHPNAAEWHYVAQGRVRMTLFAADKRLATAELGVGDCAYIPAASGHTVSNVGSTPCYLISVLNSPRYEEATLSDWLRGAPRHLLANNLGVAEAAVPSFGRMGPIVPA